MTTESLPNVPFEALVGEHSLSGVDFGQTPVGGGYYDEDAETCTFVLDGETYTVTEDPSDGYRSAMKSLAKGGVSVQNTFWPCRVLCSIECKAGGYDADLLVMRDIITGREVLAIGTENVNDYYPCYIARFDPTAMAINSAQEATP